jgi:hypothetical protein
VIRSHRYLLSIDRGGIRGIIPAVALVKLEQTIGKLSREIFSFVAGTSTGALIAAGITAGIPAARILDLYMRRTSEIFTRSPWNIFKRVVYGAMYSTLPEEIPPDDVRSVNRLREYGERLAEQIDWEAILAGTDTTFRIGTHKTLWHQYRQPIA